MRGYCHEPEGGARSIRVAAPRVFIEPEIMGFRKVTHSIETGRSGISFSDHARCGRLRGLFAERLRFWFRLR